MQTRARQWRCKITATSGRVSGNYYVQAPNSDAAHVYVQRQIASDWLLPDEEISRIITTEISDAAAMRALGADIAPPLFPL